MKEIQNEHNKQMLMTALKHVMKLKDLNIDEDNHSGKYLNEDNKEDSRYLGKRIELTDLEGRGVQEWLPGMVHLADLLSEILDKKPIKNTYEDVLRMKHD